MHEPPRGFEPTPLDDPVSLVRVFGLVCVDLVHPPESSAMLIVRSYQSLVPRPKSCPDSRVLCISVWSSLGMVWPGPLPIHSVC